MASTTINPGLEVWHLSWKDDSFRMAEWFEWEVSGPTFDNQITFTNGTITTYGDFSPNYSTPATPSVVLTNGDEMTLPAINLSSEAIYVQKDFGTDATYLPIPPNAIVSVNFRAKNIGVSNTITITLLQAPSHAVILPAITIEGTQYQRYTIPVSGLGYNVTGIRLQVNTSSVILDYICFSTCDFINQGGMSFDVTIPKKTVSQTVPNNADIIQQLGIGSRSLAVIIPKVSATVYRWLEDKEANSTPLEVVSPTQQATGYVSDISRHSEAGWVDVPLPTADSLSVQSLIDQQVYDVSFTLAKADNEQNIDATIPTCPEATPLVVPTQVSILPVTTVLAPIGTAIPLEVSSFTEARSAKLVTYSRVQAYLDTSLVIGTFNPTYTLTAVVPQDFAHGEDVETLLAGLQYQYQLLTDAEGYGDYVAITQMQPSHTGGQPYFYSVDITATSLGLPLIVPTPPPVPPTPIYSTTSGLEGSYLPERNLAYANGLWWLFYYDSSYSSFVYRTSSDGLIWSSSTVLTASGSSSIYFTIWIKGTTFYYATTNDSGGNTYWWRYGTLNSNGTITWTISESTNTTEYNKSSFVSLCVDNSNNVWYLTTTFTGSVWKAEVWEYSSGSWSQVRVFGSYAPFLYATPGTAIIPTSSVGVAELFGAGPIYATEGTNPTVVATTNSYDPSGSFFLGWSAVVSGDKVYVVAINSVTGHPEFLTYDAVFPTWSTPTVLSSATMASGPSSLASITLTINGNNLVAFFTDGTSTLWYVSSKNLGITWTSPTVLTTFPLHINLINIWAPYSSSQNVYGVSWLTYHTVPPLDYTIYFATISI